MIIQYSLVFLLKVTLYLIFARVIISWLPIDKSQPIILFVYNITDVILEPIRKIINRSSMGGGFMIDFSPIIAYFFIQVLITLVSNYIRF